MAKGTDIYIISGKKQSFRVGAFTITADSVPDFDNWGWDDYWDCADWKRWHEVKKAAHGLEAANAAFIQYWGAQDAFMAPYNWCKYRSDFAQYFADQGIDVGWLFSHLVVTTSEVGDDVLDTTQSLGTGLKWIGTVVKYAAPVAAIVGGVWVVDKYVTPIFPKSKSR